MWWGQAPSVSGDLADAPLLTLAGGRYELGPVLGTGGMASVRRGTDTVLGRPVAVKVFRADMDEDGARRAEVEMQTLAALGHPGLVSVYDAGTEEHPDGRPPTPYLVMELVEGPTLAACCADGSLSPERLATIGAQLADALHYVHARGVVHRDVKPANILLSPNGPKLADFGIARIVDSARHTGTGLTIGTAPYLSPEQVTGTPVGPPADIYALGLVLLEALTGRREYDGGPVECALARLHRAPAVPRSLPAPWPELLAAMTAREPADRPTAVEVAERLRPGVPTQVMAAADLTDAAPTTALPVADTRIAPAFVPPARVPSPTRTRGPLAESAWEVARSPLGRVLMIALLCVLVVVGLVVVSHAGASKKAGTSTPVTTPAATRPSPATQPPTSNLDTDIEDLRKAVTP